MNQIGMVRGLLAVLLYCTACISSASYPGMSGLTIEDTRIVTEDDVIDPMMIDPVSSVPVAVVSCTPRISISLSPAVLKC